MSVSYLAETLEYGESLLGKLTVKGLATVPAARLGLVEIGSSGVSMLMLPVESTAVTLCRLGSLTPPLRSML
jgi:hypothetical protein